MHTGPQRDYSHRARRIGPDRRSREARVAKRAEGEKFAAIAGKAGRDVPGKPARAARVVDEARASHFSDSQRCEYTEAAVLASVQDHLTIDREITCGGE